MNAGVTPTDADGGRPSATSAGPPTLQTEARARALRGVAESPALKRARPTGAFVMMHICGYLRRDPDETPDTDLTATTTGLGKLLEFGGDYERAEMVKAFSRRSNTAAALEISKADGSGQLRQEGGLTEEEAAS